MREDCCHYESRTYDDGEVARFCTLGLAPEAPWRCPDDCPRYERIALLTGDLERGSLATTPPVEDEPVGVDNDTLAMLADAERMVGEAEADALADLRGRGKKKRWWRRRRDDGDDDGSHLSNR